MKRRVFMALPLAALPLTVPDPLPIKPSAFQAINLDNFIDMIWYEAAISPVDQVDVAMCVFERARLNRTSWQRELTHPNAFVWWMPQHVQRHVRDKESWNQCQKSLYETIEVLNFNLIVQLSSGYKFKYENFPTHFHDHSIEPPSWTDGMIALRCSTYFQFYRDPNYGGA